MWMLFSQRREMKEFMQQLAQDSYWHDTRSGELNEKLQREDSLFLYSDLSQTLFQGI